MAKDRKFLRVRAAKNGIGFAATCDLVSFLRYDTTRANPLVARGTPDARAVPPIRHVLGFGSSQKG